MKGTISEVKLTMKYSLSFVLVSCCLNYVLSDYSFYFQPPHEETEQIAFDKLRIFEDKLQESIESMVRRVLPSIIRYGYEANITNECTSSLMKLLLDFKDLKLWAYLMMDATGKHEGGFSSGTIGALGSYHQCLDIVERGQDKVIQGQYCLVDLKPPLPPKPKQLMLGQSIFQNINGSFKTEMMIETNWFLFAFYDLSFRIGLCIPSTCSKEDLNELLKQVLGSFQIKTGVLSCEVKQEMSLDYLQCFVIVSCLSILGINIICTVGSKVNILRTKPSLENKAVVSSAFTKAVASFSILDNFRKSISTERRKDSTLDFLDGIRFLSMTWVVLGHAYCIVNAYTLRNIRNIEHIVNDIFFEALNSGFLAVDTFIFIGGTVMAFGVIKHMANKKFKLREALIFAVCRIWRVLPCMLLIIGFTFLLPLIGSGPMWRDYTEGIANNCRKSWWANVLFINNYYNNLYDMCLSHTWYMSVDFQCFVFGLIYLLLLYKRPNFGKVFVAVIIIVSVSLSGFVTYYFEYPPTILIKKSIFLDFRHGVQYMALSYISSHVHLGVYCLGLVTGTFIANTPKLQLNIVTVKVGWIIAVLSGLALVYGIHHWNEGVSYTPAEAIVFSSLQKLIWGLLLSWVCLACYSGNGGFVYQLLSWAGFKPLAQLSYLVYLIHYLVAIGYVANGQGPSDFSHSRFVFFFFGILCISHILAFFLNIVFEFPLIQITKLIYQEAMLKSTKTPEKIANANELSNASTVGAVQNGKLPSAINEFVDATSVNRVNFKEFVNAENHTSRF